MVAPPSKLPVPLPRLYRRFLYVLVPLLVTAISFAPALTNSFTNWDDPEYVTKDPLIWSLSVTNICNIFSPGTLVSANYHPVTILSLALNYAAGWLNPVGYIAANIFLHLLNVLLRCSPIAGTRRVNPRSRTLIPVFFVFFHCFPSRSA